MYRNVGGKNSVAACSVRRLRADLRVRLKPWNHAYSHFLRQSRMQGLSGTIDTESKGCSLSAV